MALAVFVFLNVKKESVLLGFYFIYINSSLLNFAILILFQPPYMDCPFDC